MPRARKPALGYRWHLRRLMADAGLYATTELTPLLAERGIVLSQAQVYRLVTGTPEVCVDTVGAGSGETVIVTKGSSARFAADRREAPIDSTIVGIVDTVEIDGR